MILQSYAAWVWGENDPPAIAVVIQSSVAFFQELSDESLNQG